MDHDNNILLQIQLDEIITEDVDNQQYLFLYLIQVKKLDCFRFI